MLTTRLTIPAAHGCLEALLDGPPAPQALALVCHLHPAFGGHMHNNTVYRIAKAWNEAGTSSLRFNFRGVGKSTGTHSGGPGELEDAHTALDFLHQKGPSLPLVVSGFSFGAYAALSLALKDTRVRGTLAVGAGVDFFDMRFVTQLKQPAAFVHAEKDEFGKWEHLQALTQQMQAPCKLFVVPGASHLFVGHMQSLEEQLTQATTWLLQTVL